MLSPMSRKFRSPNHVLPKGCIAIRIIFLLLLSACKGQEESLDPFTPLVVGGADAPKGRFPYMCSIRKRGNERHVCGGTLIDDQWVMTAAHCLDPRSSNSAGMSPFLYCGIYEREEQDTTKRFTPSRCYLHHLWDGVVRNGNDIALCQLETPASIAFPDLSNIGDDYTRDDLFTVLGWGRTSSRGSPADILQIGEGLKYVLPSLCNEVPAWAGRIKSSMLCAGFASSNTCRGDSGGPLLIRHDPVSATKAEDPLLDLIVGITSFGLRDCEADAPSVYTRVSCYRPWIDCIMDGRTQDCGVHSPCGKDSSSSSAEDPTLCSGVQKSATFDETDALRRMTRAIFSDESETVKKLLCDGLSPNSVYDRFNNSLLHRAAQYDAIESAKVLLEHGAAIEYKNSFGQAPLSRAASYGSVAVAKLLIEEGADAETKGDLGWTPLIYAARYNELEVAKILIENGANIESIDNRRWTPLHFAAEENSIDVAKILIENGASVDRKERWEWTPLHLAAQDNSTEVAKELIANGADLESKERFSLTPLHLAALHDATDVAKVESVYSRLSLRDRKVLITNGANLESRESDERTPLHVAARYDSIGVAKELIANGAEVDSREGSEWTPLHRAALYNSIGVAKELIANGAAVDATESWEWAPLHVAAQNNSIDVAKELIDNGATIDALERWDWTPLHFSAQCNSIEMAEVLISNGANIGAKTNVGSSPLHIAAYHGSLSIVLLLLDEDAIVDSRNNDGGTPLHNAASRGHTAVVRNLLRNGAAKTRTDDDGDTPFDVICTNEFLDKPCNNGVITTLQELLRA